MDNKKSNLIQEEKNYNSYLGGMANNKADKTELNTKVDNNNYVANNAYAVTAGTATAYTIALDPAPNSYIDGMQITINPHINCGASPTLNVNGLGALTILKQDGGAITAGEIKANKPLSFVRVGNNFFIRSSGIDLTKYNKVEYGIFIPPSNQYDFHVPLNLDFEPHTIMVQVMGRIVQYHSYASGVEVHNSFIIYSNKYNFLNSYKIADGYHGIAEQPQTIYISINNINRTGFTMSIRGKYITGSTIELHYLVLG